MTVPMAGSDREIRVKLAVEALERAARAGSPVGPPTDEVALIAVRRWESFERRNPSFSGSERQHRITDMAKGFGDHWDGSYRHPWIASQICDALCFMLPAGVTDLSSPSAVNTMAADTGLDRLEHVAAQADMRVRAAPPQKRDAARSFDTYELTGRTPTWALLHRTVPIFAFTHQDPAHLVEEPIIVADPSFDFGWLISGDWRWLSARQAAEPLRPQHLADLTDLDRNALDAKQPTTLAEAIFYTAV